MDDVLWQNMAEHGGDTIGDTIESSQVYFKRSSCREKYYICKMHNQSQSENIYLKYIQDLILFNRCTYPIINYP